jgi:hypothetical protein
MPASWTWAFQPPDTLFFVNYSVWVFFFPFFLPGAGDGTQGTKHAEHTLYYWATLPAQLSGTLLQQQKID